MTAASAEISRIENALNALLNEIVERTATEPRMPKATPLGAPPFKHRPLNEFPSREETEVDEILKDPVGSACRYAIKHLGQRLFDITKDIDVMRDVLNRVADRDLNHSGVRGDIMDKWWEGVGQGDVRWRS